MGAHEHLKSHKAVWVGRALSITSRDELHELKFQPHFKSWPKLVRRLKNHGHICEVKLVGRTLSVTTTAGLREIQTLLGSRRNVKKQRYRIIFVTPVVAVLGALAFTLQPENYSTGSKVELFHYDECGIEKLTEAIVSDWPNSVILERTSSRLGGIESGTFVCDDQRFTYTLELQEPKRVISLSELDS